MISQAWSLLLLSAVCAVRAADIHEAVRSNDMSAIKAALSSGEDINKIGPGGQTPLMHGVLQGMTQSVKYLLKRGADTSIPEKDGYTPMHGAGFQGRADIAKLLIAHGLDKSERHSDGFTPIHRACWGREPRHTETLRVLLEAGVRYDEAGTDGKTPLQMTKSSNQASHELLQLFSSNDKQEL